MRIFPALVALSLAAAAGGACAESTTWKWRDANGQVHVSDLPPPPSVPASAILARPPQVNRWIAPPAAAASAAKAAASGVARTDPELDARRRRSDEEQLTQKKLQDEKDAATRADNCTRARSNLAALQDGQRMVRANAQGEREVLDDKGRAEEIARARAIISSDCGK